MYRWQVGLLNGELFVLYRGNDRLGEWLSIFLLHQRLNAWPVDLLCCRIILLVLVQDYRVGRAIF